MFQMKFKFVDETRKVRRAVDQYKVENLGHAAALVRITARRLIRRRKGYAKPGKPPHTHTGLLRNSIVYDISKQRDEALIGPTANVIGTIGGLHEFGGKSRAGRYPARSFMGPAFETILPRLPAIWRNSLRGG